MAFNTAVHESTKATPDTLFLGREMGSPLEARWDLSSVGSGQVNRTDREFWSQAYQNLKQASRKVALRYNRGRKPHCFTVGNTVSYRLNLVSSKAREVSVKIMLRWSEPVVIAREIRPNVVMLANPSTGVVVRRAHVSQLKSCVL